MILKAPVLLNCYEDGRGFRRAETPPGLETLRTFLEDDVQGSLDGCELLLKELSDVEKGARPPFDFTGNACNVAVEPGTVTIENLWDDSSMPLKLSPMEYRQAISEWRAFLHDNQPLYTLEQYTVAERRAEFKGEFVSGRISLRGGSSRWHNMIMGSIVHRLSSCLRKSPCETYPGDMKVLIGAAASGVYPDVTVTSDNPQFLDHHNDVLLNPLVIVEVLSDSTEAYDRGEKFALYQRLDSLQEYLLVSQNKARVKKYHRQPDSQWLYSRADGLEGEVSLEALGCRLPLSEVYARVTFAPDEMGTNTAGEHNA